MKNIIRKLPGKKAIVLSMMLTLVMSVTVMGAYAADTVDVTTVLGSSFQTMINDMLGMIGSILPIAMTVLGASLAVAFGIKWFKKIIGKA